MGVREIYMKIGIDKIGFYSPHLYVDMEDLAHARDEDPGKFKIGIGQDEMALAPVTQDPVTLAANAALQCLTEEDKEAIDFVMFGTESGIDASKAGAVYVKKLLGLNDAVRSIELKQACYGATAALQLAKGHVALNSDKKVLVLASDIARYGLNTAGEVTQGAGALALLISKDPEVLSLNDHSAYITRDIMDFWRPTYSDVAYVDGQYSNEQYIEFFNDAWKQYKEKTNESLDDFTALCFHLPYTRMGIKALRTILDEASDETKERLEKHYQTSTLYSRKVGNIYTASLYLALLSLLEQAEDLQVGDQIGLFSYGSGAVGEFFSGKIESIQAAQQLRDVHEKMFTSRKKVTISEYERLFEQTLPTDGSTLTLDTSDDLGRTVVTGITEHKRQYKRQS